MAQPHSARKAEPAAQAHDRRRVAEAGEEHRELEVHEWRRVPDPVLVHEGVGGDEARDGEAEKHPRRLGRPAQAADEEDAESYEADACRLLRRAAEPERGHADDEDENRRRPARDRVDDRELGPT